MSQRSDPTYKILYCSADQANPTLVETKQFVDDTEANIYITEQNRNRVNKEGFYRWQRATFFDKF